MMTEHMEDKKPFTVTDEASAEWCLEKLEENQKARALIEEQYKQMTERYEKWRADALAELESNDSYLKGLLEPWAAEKITGTKKKSVRLPSGLIGFRAGKEEWKIGAEEVTAESAALLAFVKKDDDTFVKVKETVRWGDYKKTLTVMEDGRVVSATGQIIEGMTVTQKEPNFYVNIEGS